MSTYKNLIGKDVNFLSTDPDNAEAEGQIWYNSTSGVFKDAIVGEAWSAGANLITQNYAGGAAGPQTAGLGFAGDDGSTKQNTTIEYNGSGWSSVPATINTARSYVVSAAAGTQTSTLCVGGEGGSPSPSGKTESYDGSSWTEESDMTNSRDSGLGFGTENAFIYSGGVPGYPWTAPASTSTESWNGSSWTATPAVNNPRAQGGGFGISTAGLIFGGRTTRLSVNPQALVATTESYDGSSWTSLNSMNDGRLYASSGSGTLTAGITAGGIAYPGGSPADTNKSESWNGTSWSEGPNLATTRYVGSGSFGSATSALVYGGRSGGTIFSVTEEFNKSVNVVTAAAFSSGGAANTARRQLGYTGAGTQNAFMVYGGFAPAGMLNASEEYGGATWTATPNLNTARGQDAGFGITTAAVCCGGATPTVGGYTEEYNGSSWTTVNSMSTNRYEFGATGILTAGLALQGDQGPSTPFGVTCEEYDGTNWSSGGSANTARRTNSGVGTQTATITAGGQIPGPGKTANVESYNGTSWSEVSDLNVARAGNAIMGGPAGATTSVVTGGSPGPMAITEQWNGSSMVTGVNMANDRSVHGAGGTSASGIVGLGQTGPSPPYGDAFTEEYVGETSALNIKTITTS